MRPLRCAVAVLALAALAACSYPTRNVPAESLNQREGYRWSNLVGGELEDTLFVVTASGGGTRATALALATLKTLHRARLESGRSLAQEVDIISSVSGGSVAAGYFAYAGVGGFDTLENDFIRKDGISALLWDGLNPVGLAELATPSKERIDLLIDYLDRQLFADATFKALLTADGDGADGAGRPRGQRPFLILNAADMVSGTVFPFTQYHLDLLCSDLRAVKLSTAVAASAAFPVAMSPVTLRNYSVCPAQEARADWPPVWIEQALATDYHVNADRLRRGRVARSYAQADALEAPFGARYVHLLDGGTADNLGISEPFRLITTADVSPTLLNDIMMGRIERVVFVLVNARSQPANALNVQLATPGIPDMLLGTINTSIDNATFGNLDRIRTLLRERLEAVADDPNTPEPVRQRLRGFESHFLPVDFAAIPDRDCRRAFQAIATSWTLPDHEIDALLEVAGPLLAADPEFDRVLQAVGASYAPPNAGLEQACETVMKAPAG